MSPSPESPTPHACPSEGRSRPVVRAGSFLLLLLGCAPAATPPTGRVSPQLPMGDPRIPSEQAVLAFDMSTRTADGRLRDLTLNGLPADVRLNVREFPVLRTVTLVNGDTGELL